MTPEPDRGSTYCRVRAVWCRFVRRWVPMRRARTRCPSCGAAIGVAGHVIEFLDPDTAKAPR